MATQVSSKKGPVLCADKKNLLAVNHNVLKIMCEQQADVFIINALEERRKISPSCLVLPIWPAASFILPAHFLL